jgi:chemotaxis protein CheZ
VQRKIFRIEQTYGRSRPVTAAPLRAERHDQPSAADTQSLKAELADIRDTLARNKRDLTALLGEGNDRRLVRASGELAAAVDGMEKATVGILKSVEVVDESAKALTATLKDDYSRGLAHDIQEHVVKIYEVCNFQDLAGQRIGNVIATLRAVEEQVAAMIERCDGNGAGNASAAVKPRAGSSLLNGPRIDGDSGHASQRDVDKMFG